MKNKVLYVLSVGGVVLSAVILIAVVLGGNNSDQEKSTVVINSDKAADSRQETLTPSKWGDELDRGTLDTSMVSLSPQAPVPREKRELLSKDELLAQAYDRQRQLAEERGRLEEFEQKWEEKKERVEARIEKRLERRAEHEKRNEQRAAKRAERKKQREAVKAEVEAAGQQ